MADLDSWDADNFEPDEPIKKAAVLDKWEGEDEEEDVKDNWDDEEEEKEEKKEEEEEEKKTEVKVSDKKKLSEKIKEKESRQLKKKEELKNKLELELESEEITELTPEEQLEEKLRVQKLQEEADLELAKEAFGVSNNVTGIDSMNPSSKEDFTEFGRLLKEKMSQYEKSVHYSNFLDSLFRDLCISLEVEDLKKVSNSLTVLLSEKQKQEKQNKAKKKKKGVLPGGGLKANLKDDLDDYGHFDGGYAQDYEDFM
ncbi:eukaryotic translation initiation factor 3 subunit J-B isoform X1 [Brienomyrus brachyistius]|uniref:eukaryotic translation initiation factor 3 subunit J-B isoform X1 n=1 Tax=Brienomyrus brachyistius TaxID=42636 RepID=UPI0020B17ECF|nr:eukaryotic translation initiation factor 3 subunit J-B isoform X1 [Brienomyrus brachyistius]